MKTSGKTILFPCIASELKRHLGLRIECGDQKAYHLFRSYEPALVSCIDDRPNNQRPVPEILLARCHGRAAGILSFIVEINQMRGVFANKFSRLDLVIVAKQFRGLGIGRLLVLSALVHLLKTGENSIYSISCLAAHEAIVKILEEIGFRGSERPGLNFRHEELKLDESKNKALLENFRIHLRSAAMRTSYRLRQAS